MYGANIFLCLTIRNFKCIELKFRFNCILQKSIINDIDISLVGSQGQCQLVSSMLYLRKYFRETETGQQCIASTKLK